MWSDQCPSANTLNASRDAAAAADAGCSSEHKSHAAARRDTSQRPATGRRGKPWERTHHGDVDPGGKCGAIFKELERNWPGWVVRKREETVGQRVVRGVVDGGVPLDPGPRVGAAGPVGREVASGSAGLPVEEQVGQHSRDRGAKDGADQLRRGRVLSNHSVIAADNVQPVVRQERPVGHKLCQSERCQLVLHNPAARRHNVIGTLGGWVAR